MDTFDGPSSESTKARVGARLEPLEQAARGIETALRALGVEPAGPNLEGTPERVARLWSELFGGVQPEREPEISSYPNPDQSSGMIVARGLPFYSMCAHHLLPFFGLAHVGSLPGQSVIGLGAMAQLLDYHARRPTLQENLASEVANAIERAVSPRGVAVLLEGRHLCLEMRGERARARIDTSAWRGAFDEDARRAEFLYRVRPKSR